MSRDKIRSLHKLRAHTPQRRQTPPSIQALATPTLQAAAKATGGRQQPRPLLTLRPSPLRRLGTPSRTPQATLKRPPPHLPRRMHAPATQAAKQHHQSERLTQQRPHPRRPGPTAETNQIRQVHEKPIGPGPPNASNQINFSGMTWFDPPPSPLCVLQISAVQDCPSGKIFLPFPLIHPHHTESPQDGIKKAHAAPRLSMHQESKIKNQGRLKRAC